MGIFSRLFGRTDPYPITPGKQEITLIEGDGSMEVVGESHYQDDLREAFRRAEDSGDPRRRRIITILHPEPHNPHDPNAVGVYALNGQVGHLSRQEATRWQQEIADAWKRNATPIAVRATVVTGPNDIYGVWLDWPEGFIEDDEPA